MMRNFKVLAAGLAALFLLFTHTTYAAKPVKEWTMLVFINGHNNLDYFGQKDINEMEQVGSTDQVNVVVQWASLKHKQTRRLLVQKDNDPYTVTSPLLQELPRLDMGDYRNLVEFIRWGHENFPARHYFVVVWNHGTGWHPLNQPFKPAHVWDISFDDLTKNKITTQQLGLAMEEAAAIVGRRIDIYGSDACLMGMIEVAHQMKDSVEYFIGSQDLEPGEGWPYDKLLERWNQLQPATAKDIAKLVPKVFAESYDDGSQGDAEVTLSSFDLKEIDALTTALSNLRVTLVNEATENKSALEVAIINSLKFAYSDYVDLGDFLIHLRNRIPTPATSPFISDVEAAIKSFVIANETTGYFKRAHGVAIWLPGTKSEYNKNEKSYRDLSFAIVSQWHLVAEGLF